MQAETLRPLVWPSLPGGHQAKGSKSPLANPRWLPVAVSGPPASEVLFASTMRWLAPVLVGKPPSARWPLMEAILVRPANSRTEGRLGTSRSRAFRKRKSNQEARMRSMPSALLAECLTIAHGCAVSTAGHPFPRPVHRLRGDLPRQMFVGRVPGAFRESSVPCQEPPWRPRPPPKAGCACGTPRHRATATENH